MKIKNIFQDLHNKKIKEDWELIQIIEKDICLLYHQLSQYNYIMEDLYYKSVYQLPYWDILNLDLPQDHADFIYEGCLVFIFAMTMELINGSGSYLYKYLDETIESVKHFSKNNKKTKKLKSIVLEALLYVKNQQENTKKEEELFKSSMWIHENYVKEYFYSIYNSFKTNSYFK